MKVKSNVSCVDERNSTTLQNGAAWRSMAETASEVRNKTVAESDFAKFHQEIDRSVYLVIFHYKTDRPAKDIQKGRSEKWRIKGGKNKS